MHHRALWFQQMGFFSAHPCWIALCFFRIMAPTCWDRPEVRIFSSRMFTDNRLTEETVGKPLLKYIFLHDIITHYLSSSSLCPASPEPPALLAEISTRWLSLCPSPGAAVSFPPGHPCPRLCRTARPRLPLLVARGEPGAIPGLWCPPVSPSRNDSAEQNPLEIPRRVMILRDAWASGAELKIEIKLTGQTSCPWLKARNRSTQLTLNRAEKNKFCYVQ